MRARLTSPEAANSSSPAFGPWMTKARLAAVFLKPPESVSRPAAISTVA